MRLLILWRRRGFLLCVVLLSQPLVTISRRRRRPIVSSRLLLIDLIGSTVLYEGPPRLRTRLRTPYSHSYFLVDLVFVCPVFDVSVTSLDVHQGPSVSHTQYCHSDPTPVCDLPLDTIPQTRNRTYTVPWWLPTIRSYTTSVILQNVPEDP